MADFDLDNSRWFNTMRVNHSARYLRDNCAALTKHCNVLSTFTHDAVMSQTLANAELALTDALLAVQLARENYERHTKPALKVAV
jgi:hypothetical protein